MESAFEFSGCFVGYLGDTLVVCIVNVYNGSPHPRDEGTPQCRFMQHYILCTCTTSYIKRSIIELVLTEID